MPSTKKAQATIEYLILFSVLIAAIIIGAQAYLKGGVTASLNNLGNVLKNEMHF